MYHESHDHQNQSDNDEGFVPSKIVIKEKKQFHGKKQKLHPQPKKEFVPRYITEGIMRKQPPECYKRFHKFDFIQHSVNTSKIEEEEQNTAIQGIANIEIKKDTEGSSKQRGKIKQKLSTPYDKYVASGEYILTYSRYRDFKFSNQEPNFAINQVRLDCLKSAEEMKFKPIKPFQIIQQRGESILTQGMNRNSSIREPLLQFDSKFECGNLLCAFKHRKQPYTYTLFIQNDTNSNGYNQWFYFSIRNAQTKIKYKFHIVNFRKRHSFFRSGNMPVVFSLLDSKKPNMSGYSKRGENVSYGKSSIVKSYDSKEKFYQLSFQLDFKNQDDICYISMGLPYSYSKLLHNLSIYQQMAKQNNVKFQLQSLGFSIAGNTIPYLTITEPEDIIEEDKNQFRNSSTFYHPKNRQENSLFARQRTEQQTSTPKKKVILIMSRQHPGQTWSSYLMDEIILNLVTRQSPQTQHLLKNYIIKVIPMINVDGIISGNFRCDLSGMDLNRNWKYPSALLHPQIFSIKNEVLSLVNQGYKIEACFDLHGHSKQYNVFCYSCKTDDLQCRILPYIFSQINEEFHFPFCTFGISPYKQSTARAVIFSIIKNTNVLTIESSFFATKKDGKVKILEPQNFGKMANTLIQGCKSYLSHDKNYEASRETVKSKLAEFLQFQTQKEDVVSGSDSQPSADEIQLMQKLQSIVPKNLISECVDSAVNKKTLKRANKSLKRKTFQATQNRMKKQFFSSLNKNVTIDVVQQVPQKQLKSNWDKIKVKNKIPLEPKKLSHLKKNSIFTNNQALDESSTQEEKYQRMVIKDMIEREEKKLPFFSRQKPAFIPMRMKNESFQIFKDAYNATEKYIKHVNQSSFDEIKYSRRQPSRLIGIVKEPKQKEIDQFPLLCVLSENKKKNQADKVNQRKQDNSVNNSNQSRLPQKVKTAIQARTQAIKKLRQKDKNSMQIVSKIWRQNFTRYGMAFSAFKISK